MHTASLYSLDTKDPQKDLVEPALEGTRNVLGACKKAGSVKRVVLTSSMAAITDEPESDHVLTENDWNEKSSLGPFASEERGLSPITAPITTDWPSYLTH